MKKFFAVVGMILGCTFLAQCATVGAPGFSPERGRYVIGLEYNSLRGREFTDPKFGTQKLDTTGKHYVGRILYGLTDRIGLQAKIASADLDIWNPDASTDYVHSSDLGWGLGFRTIFYEDLKLGLSLVGSGQYFTFKPRATSDNRTAESKEWDGAVFMNIVNQITEPKPLIEPFALTSTSFHMGIRASDATIDWTYGAQSGQLEAASNFGYFMGFDFIFSDNYVFGIEGRFNDETAYTGVLGFKF